MIDLKTIWNGISINLIDRIDAEQLTIIQQAVMCELGKYDFTEKVNCTELTTYDDDMTGYTMFFCSKGVEGLSKRTLKYYKETIDRFLNFIGKPLKAITTDDIRFYLAHRHTKDGICIITMESERRNLNSFFGWLAEEGYIPKNVCKSIKKIKSPKTKKKAFTEVELQKIKDACMIQPHYFKEESTARNIALIEFMISTGCRVGEISTLKRESVDLENSCAVVVGKGNKERTVYLTQVCKMRLIEYWNVSGKREYAFSTLGKDVQWQISGIEIKVREIGKNAGVEKCHPHRFRRTCATIAIKKGMDIIDVQRMLGHENLDTTKIYLDLDNSNLAYQHTKIFG